LLYKYLVRTKNISYVDFRKKLITIELELTIIRYCFCHTPSYEKKFIQSESFLVVEKMEFGHVIEILTATLDPALQEAAGKKLDEVCSAVTL